MSHIESTASFAGLGGDPEFGDPSKLPAAPLVSVFMITYQHSAFIREAIDSILMQQVDFPYEICIGDDESKDGTREICLEYAQKHPDKFRLFLRNRANPARRAFAAPFMFNMASTFDACRGKYIALLEGDDCWLSPHKLQTQVKLLEANPGLAASCHYAACLTVGKPWALSVTPTCPVESFDVEAVLKRDVGNVHTSTWLLRRGIPVPWHKLVSSPFGEYPMIVCAMLQGTAQAMPQVWSLYRYHATAVFTSRSAETRLEWNLELWKCLESVVPPNLRAATAIGLSRTRNMLTRALSKAAKFGPALHCFRRNLSEIARHQSPASERRRLRWRALEALVLPHLQGLRERANRRRARTMPVPQATLSSTADLSLRGLNSHTRPPL
jgi:hypothetical protein